MPRRPDLCGGNVQYCRWIAPIAESNSGMAPISHSEVRNTIDATADLDLVGELEVVYRALDAEVAP